MCVCISRFKVLVYLSQYIYIYIYILLQRWMAALFLKDSWWRPEYVLLFFLLYFFSIFSLNTKYSQPEMKWPCKAWSPTPLSPDTTSSAPQPLSWTPVTFCPSAASDCWPGLHKQRPSMSSCPLVCLVLSLYAFSTCPSLLFSTLNQAEWIADSS